MATDSNAAQLAVRLALEFLERVWGPGHELDAIDELMTEDYSIISGGKLIEGRNAFKEWVREFQRVLPQARTVNQEAFANAAGDMVVSRWICTGNNNGIFGLPPDGRLVSFTGISMWKVRDQRLAECWVERSALELYKELSALA